MKYDDYVINSILATNRFGITTVNNLQSLNFLNFHREEFPAIEKLVQANDTEAIKNLSKSKPKTGEYLDIMSFSDQNGVLYTVAVYDSDALEQDPQAINTYRPQ